MQRIAIRLVAPALWALAPAVASAQSEVTLEKVVVTGSNIPRVESESATPTLVLTRKDIERTGLSTVKEVLDSLVGTSQLSTGSNRTLSDINGSNSFAAGSSAVSLRFLGPQATLVLLNSRRLASYAMHDDPGMVTDVNALPLAAVERIEVLRNGGAAVYGSDAIAGVINIITKQDFRGFELRASREASTGAGELNATTFGLTGGFGNLAEDRFNVMVNAEYYKRSSVMWRQLMDRVDGGITDIYPSFGSPSIYSSPGNNLDGSGAIAGCATVVDGLCMYDRYSRFEAQPSSERANLLVSGRLNIDADLQGFSEVLLSRTRTGYTAADPAYGNPDFLTWFDPGTGKTKTFVYRGLPKEHPLNDSGLDDAALTYRFADANSQQIVHADAYRALAGLRGAHRGFDWEGALGFAGSRVEQQLRGAFSDSAFKSLIGDYNLVHDPLFFNRGYVLGGPNSQAVLDQLFPWFSHTGRLNTIWVDGKASGPVGTWDGRAVEAAFGFDVRHERLSITPSANMLSGDIVGYGVAQTEGSRTFGAVFSEVNVPITDRLDVSAAARLDKYPTFDVNLSPKLGARFKATNELMLRGTLEAGFRAPNLVESSSSTLYSFDNGLYDPKRCPQARALASDLTTRANDPATDDATRRALLARAQIVETVECSGYAAAERRSNSELKPEKSLGTTLGLVFQPARDLAFEVDAWRIERRDEIGYRAAQELVDGEDGSAGVIERLSLADDRSFTSAEQGQYGVTAGALSATHGQYENSARTLVQGVDFASTQRTLTPVGPLTLQLQASFLDRYQRWSPVLSSYGDNLAGRYGYPRWRGYLVGALETGPVANALRLNYTGKTTLQGDWFDSSWNEQGCAEQGIPAHDCQVKSFLTLDWAVTWTLVKGLVLGVNVRNVFDARPPRDWRALGESGSGVIPQSLLEAYGRTVRLSLAYKFL